MKIALTLVASALFLTGCESMGNWWDRQTTRSAPRTDDRPQSMASMAVLGVTYPLADHTVGQEDTNPSSSNYNTNSNTNYSSTSKNTSNDRNPNDTRRQQNTDGTRQTWTSSTSANVGNADSRILSALHAANQKEIEVGRLAETRGSSPNVRQYGAALVRDHTELDRQVTNTARTLNVSLTDAASTMQREKNTNIRSDSSNMTNSTMNDSNNRGTTSTNATGNTMNDPNNRNTSSNWSATDHTAEFRNLNGSEFDRVFTEKSRQCHRDLIQTIESERSNLQDQSVRNLADQALNKLREHEQMATNIISPR